MNKLYAIVGMCGSGKSIASDYLVSKGFNKVYFGGVTMDKLKEANLEVNPENEKMMREKLRSELGMGAFAIVLLPKIKECFNNGNTVLDGVYSYDEVKILKENFPELKIIAIVCDKDIRYDRLSIREVRPLTNEEASARDIAEVENIAKAPPIAMADYYILNNGSVEEYKTRLEEILERND
ncbi:MAG: AAA family ATPase [Bacilli bacterium]|nr:AAA family ATPase [Bacilli bacterium]